MALTTVNSDGIKDGSIVNADIKSDAAISPSKIDAANFGGIGSNGHIELKNETSAKFFEASANGTNKIAVKAPAALAADYTLTLPVDDGAADEVLKTNGSGTLSWSAAAAGATGGGTDKAFWVNDNSIASDYPIPDGKNAGTWGPVTIAAGVTVTIGDGEYWTIM